MKRRLEIDLANQVRLFEHFKQLTRFSGREERSSFWPYAALVYVILNIGGVIAMLPVMAGTFSNMRELSQVSSEQTGRFDDAQYPTQLDGTGANFMPDFGLMMWMTAIVMLIAIILYGAAVVRRLHDSGRRGLWGMMPIPFLLFSTLMMSSFFGSFGSRTEPDMTIIFSIFISNLIYISVLVWLVVLLALGSDPEENSYGPGPGSG